MKRSVLKFLLTFLTVIGLTILNQGCASLMIASSGKRWEHLMKPSVTSEKTANELGKPIYTNVYAAPTQIMHTQEYLRYKKADGYTPRIGKWGDKTEELLAQSCCVYERKGPFAGLETGPGQVIGMGLGMTLGLGEPWMISEAIKYQRDRRDRNFHMTVWYDPRGHFLAYLKEMSVVEKMESECVFV